MLVLSRKLNQSIVIGTDVRILVVGLDREHVKLGIEAPRDVPVHRFEVTRHAGTPADPSSEPAPVGKLPAGDDISRDALRD